VRFLKSDAFQLRVGMVLPVAEKVFSQMKANSVLGVSRIRALRPTQAKKQTETILASLEAYGELLGEDRVKEEMKLIKEEFILSEASAAFAKQSVNSANRVVRSSKDFNK
jgi:hypothetical protein